MFALVKKDMELERQTRELAMQYRQASTDEREKIKPQIEEVVGKHFDVRQQRRALELKRLEQQLQQLRETIDRRSKARKEIVERRVSELTGQRRRHGVLSGRSRSGILPLHAARKRRVGPAKRSLHQETAEQMVGPLRWSHPTSVPPT